MWLWLSTFNFRNEKVPWQSSRFDISLPRLKYYIQEHIIKHIQEGTTGRVTSDLAHAVMISAPKSFRRRDFIYCDRYVVPRSQRIYNDLLLWRILCNVAK